MTIGDWIWLLVREGPLAVHALGPVAAYAWLELGPPIARRTRLMLVFRRLWRGRRPPVRPLVFTLGAA